MILHQLHLLFWFHCINSITFSFVFTYLMNRLLLNLNHLCCSRSLYFILTIPQSIHVLTINARLWCSSYVISEEDHVILNKASCVRQFIFQGLEEELSLKMLKALIKNYLLNSLMCDISLKFMIIFFVMRLIRIDNHSSLNQHWSNDRSRFCGYYLISFHDFWYKRYFIHIQDELQYDQWSLWRNMN